MVSGRQKDIKGIVKDCLSPGKMNLCDKAQQDKVTSCVKGKAMGMAAGLMLGGAAKYCPPLDLVVKAFPNKYLVSSDLTRNANAVVDGDTRLAETSEEGHRRLRGLEESSKQERDVLNRHRAHACRTRSACTDAFIYFYPKIKSKSEFYHKSRC